MNRTYISKLQYICALAILSLSLMVSGCVTEHPFHADDSEIEVNISALLPNFQEQEVLRAHLTEDEEKAVNSLYLFVFDKKGTRIKSPVLTNNFVNPEGLTIVKNLILSKGATYTFCVVANLGHELAFYQGPTVDKLNAITTIDEFKEVTITASKESLNRNGGAFVMTGMITQQVHTGQVEIPLNYVDSRVKFLINGDKFKLKKWRLFNAPKTVRLDNENNNETLSSQYYFFNNTQVGDVPFFPVEGNGDEFAFYMAPNIKQSVKEGLTDYKQRSKQEKNYTSDPYPSGQFYTTNGFFVYADRLASFVELVGEYNDGRYRSDNATYVIHLGFLNNDVNNWEVKRGHSYVYNVDIAGINEVVVEVVQDNEVNTAVEADVVDYDTDIVDLDCHYGYKLLKFTPEMLQKLSAKPAFVVNTPFDRFGTTDKDWIKFRIHEDGNTSETIKRWSDVNVNLSVDEFLTQLAQKPKNKTVYATAYINEYYYDTKPQGYIGSIADWRTDGWREFVNCQDRQMGLLLYDKADGSFNGYKLSRDRESSLLRADVLFNQRSIRTSYDLEQLPLGSTAFGVEVIEEPEMRFDRSKQNWGTPPNWNTYYPEMSDVWNGRKNYYNTLVGANGYIFKDRTSREINNKENDFWLKITEVDGKGLKVIDRYLGDYNKKQLAFLACVTLNRDENGNGKLDKDELKWYLPSKDEYILLGLTRFSFPYSVQLNPTNAPYNTFKHYVSSTRAGTKANNPISYYSEQLYSSSEALFDPACTATDFYKELWMKYAYVASNPGQYNKQKLSTRCVRKLGVKNTEHVEDLMAPDMPFKMAKLPNGNFKITSYVEEFSMRPASDKIDQGRLPEHHERSVFGRPTRSFEVYKETIGYDYTGRGQHNNYFGKVPFAAAEEACQKRIGKEWRLPSASEMQIMIMTLYPNGASNTEHNTMLKAEYGWAEFGSSSFRSKHQLYRYGHGSYRYNRHENKQTHQVSKSAYHRDNNRTLYWTSTRFSSNPLTETDRYVYALTRGWYVPTLSLVRPMIYKAHSVSTIDPDYGVGFVRCVKDS